MRALLLLALPLLLSSQARALEVLTTIKPLQLIASAITDGVSEPDLLLAPGTSPHDYALRPSDVRRINQADLVVWVGPELEGFLTSLLGDKENSLALLALIEPAEHKHHDDHGQGGHHHQPHGNHDHHHHGEHGHRDEHHTGKISIGNQDDEHEHDHGDKDPHIWLDPHQGERIATLLAERMAQLDPANADLYQRNLAIFRTELAKTDSAVAKRLAPARGKGYFVFHDAYGYWEDHYQLPSRGHFTVNPERAPGAQTVSRIHQALRDEQAVCVFAEPQFRPAVVEAVVRNTPARIGTLDPLATDIVVGPQGYFAFMQQLAEAMAACLLNE
ncbi:zinc ABC transporter substrate-binding protein ZnuA [Zobellella iuensis]|uniref:High-affinity zinc uptake system protein ZnuA n=1 Tax=Zobellella iuensis TaxID=2803811 RepID=A0ABS1QM62_9GAMM|nr:zinc ABC transporter substrate-binding protein ZnuA [Zobellella iuensis]MBL1375956.1 zinc ABC transporter substrate-binding protein ZnuA [Zobellella iuensis]